LLPCTSTSRTSLFGVSIPAAPIQVTTIHLYYYFADPRRIELPPPDRQSSILTIRPRTYFYFILRTNMKKETQLLVGLTLLNYILSLQPTTTIISSPLSTVPVVFMVTLIVFVVFIFCFVVILICYKYIKNISNRQI
jgi:hypothetical protein